MTPRPALFPAGIVRRAALDALGVLLPVACVGCGGADRAVCGQCRLALRAVPRLVERQDLRAWAALEYAGEIANAIGAFKDGARTDAAGPLAAALGAAIEAALRGLPAGSVEVCTVPSTSAALRARGYAPVELLLARCGIRSSRVLRLARARSDQAGLSADARRANADGALEACRPLDGRRFLLVDDVLTTGSTLVEAGRAVVAAGGSVAAVAVLAETPLRRSTGASRSRETLRDIAGQGGYGGMTGVVDPPFRPGDTPVDGGRHGTEHRRTKPGSHRPIPRLCSREVGEGHPSRRTSHLPRREAQPSQ